MRQFFSLIAIALLCGNSTETNAAGHSGLLQKLPKKDGTWAKYEFAVNMEVPRVKTAGILTLKSVGRATVNGKAARWIEFEVKLTENGKQRRTWTKFLVSEKPFVLGSKEKVTVYRGWTKNSDTGNIEKTTKWDSSLRKSLPVLLLVSRQGVKQLTGTRNIEYQNGRLRGAKGTVGTLKIDFGSNVPRDWTFDVADHVWQHKDAPFGTAEMRTIMTAKFKGKEAYKTQMTFTLQDFGTGAKAYIPNK